MKKLYGDQVFIYVWSYLSILLLLLLLSPLSLYYYHFLFLFLLLFLLFLLLKVDIHNSRSECWLPESDFPLVDLSLQLPAFIILFVRVGVCVFICSFSKYVVFLTRLKLFEFRIKRFCVKNLKLNFWVK